MSYRVLLLAALAAAGVRVQRRARPPALTRR